MLETLISSKTRIKLLLKFFLNSSTKAYLRNLESEFGESSNAIRVELNRLEKAGMLTAGAEGNKKIFQANTQHPLYNEIHNIVLKYVGIDRIIEHVINRMGKLELVYLSGSFAKGIDTKVIDLILIGQIDKKYLLDLSDKAEKLINRKIRTMVFEDVDEYEEYKDKEPKLLLWIKDESN